MGWKGYIDEVKVYNKAFDSDDVKNACLLYSQCTGLTPAAPDNLTATAASSSQVNVTWNAVNGADNYTLKWNTDNGTSWTTITGITGTTYSHTGRNPSTTYYYEVFGNNQAGAGTVFAVRSSQMLGKLSITHSRNLQLVPSLMIPEGHGFVLLGVSPEHEVRVAPGGLGSLQFKSIVVKTIRMIGSSFTISLGQSPQQS